MEMRSYEAARSYFSILGFMSWCVIILGGIVAIVALVAVGEASRSFGGSSMAGLAGLVPGLAITFLGFLGLVTVQIGRAGVDSAEYAQQMLKIARDQLEVSRQGLKQGAMVERGYEALQAAKAGLRTEIETPASGPNDSYANTSSSEAAVASESLRPGKDIEYRGKIIRVLEEGFAFSGREFPTLAETEAFIDQDDKFLPPRRETPVPVSAQLGPDTASDHTLPKTS